MDIENYKQIIKKIKPYSKRIYYNIGGESLLHPKIGEMIQYAKTKYPSVYTVLGTNATLLTDNIIKQIITAGLNEIIISFDGENEKEYESMRVGGKHKITLSNVNNLIYAKIKQNSKLKIIIQTLKYYGKNPLEISDSFKSQFVENDLLQFTSFYIHDWSSNFKENRLAQIPNAPKSDDYFPCDLLWRVMPISWDGNVYACCFDLERTFLIGNILNQSVEEIWNGAKMLELRNDQISKKIPELCHNCIGIWENNDSKNKVRRIAEVAIRTFGKILNKHV